MSPMVAPLATSSIVTRHDVLRVVLRDLDELREQGRNLPSSRSAPHAARAGDLPLGRVRIVRVQSRSRALPSSSTNWLTPITGLSPDLLAQRRLVGEIGDLLLEPALLDQLDRAAVAASM